MKRFLASLTVLSFLFAGCEKAAHNHDHAGHSHENGHNHDHDGNDHNHDHDHAPPAANTGSDTVAANAKVYAVECGCEIEDIGKCGNYAMIDDKPVVMAGLDIGKMPFCGKSDLKAKIAGDVADGKLVVKTFELVK